MHRVSVVPIYVYYVAIVGGRFNKLLWKIKKNIFIQNEIIIIVPSLVLLGLPAEVSDERNNRVIQFRYNRERPCRYLLSNIYNSDIFLNRI